MNTQLGFILLLEVLERKGYLTNQERSSISSIEALISLLKASSQIPPMDEDWKIFELGWEKFSNAKTKEDKLLVLSAISYYTDSNTIKELVAELLDLAEQIDNDLKS